MPDVGVRVVVVVVGGGSCNNALDKGVLFRYCPTMCLVAGRLYSLGGRHPTEPTQLKTGQSKAAPVWYRKSATKTAPDWLVRP